ncbi:MAG: hypothetical protein ABL949_11745 [Fimbriimonadaceae bacterium]
MASFRLVIQILVKIRALLLTPGNDFSWSSWQDADGAVREIDSLIGRLSAGDSVNDLSLTVLFAPTGPIQEVALSSGWADEFAKLADQFDLAMTASDCPCFGEPSSALEVVHSLGMDEEYGESWLLKCPDCGQFWLRYLYENEGFTGSGRWYLGAIDSERALSINGTRAKSELGSLTNYFVGGSYYGGEVNSRSGPIRLN